MTSIPTTCQDNPATRRVGCGAHYSGNAGHCVARADWSIRADGICHQTFSSESAAQRHWVRGVHVHPGEVRAKDGTLALVWNPDRHLWQRAGSRPWNATIAPASHATAE